MPSPDLAAMRFDDVAAAHADPAFPRFHPRPAQGWINDPNGISHINGRYHVFFQYNPDSARHHQDRLGPRELRRPGALGGTPGGAAPAARRAG